MPPQHPAGGCRAADLPVLPIRSAGRGGAVHGAVRAAQPPPAGPSPESTARGPAVAKSGGVRHDPDLLRPPPGPPGGRRGRRVWARTPQRGRFSRAKVAGMERDQLRQTADRCPVCDRKAEQEWLERRTPRWGTTTSVQLVIQSSRCRRGCLDDADLITLQSRFPTRSREVPGAPGGRPKGW